MKQLIILIISLVTVSGLTAQDVTIQKLDSKINNVSVFLNKAQITRTKKVVIPKGESEIRFVNLSPFINPKSIQVTAPGQLMILSVDHELNYKNKAKKPPKLKALETQYQKLTDDIKLAQTHLDITREQIDFLQKNKAIGGKNQPLSVAAVKSMGDYYAKQLAALKLKTLKQEKALEGLQKKQKSLRKELQKYADLKVFPSGEIVIKLSSPQRFTTPFTLKYNVDNATWFPSYTIRMNDINKPLAVTYKANVSQNTQVDWDKVYLTFSSANPSLSNDVPKLIPYRLGFGTMPPVYGTKVKEVTGYVYDASDNSPLPGVNIVVKGTSIGTSTDFDGKYHLVLPNLESPVIVFSYVGYKQQERIANQSPINVWLTPDEAILQSVVVTALGGSKHRRHLSGKIRGEKIESAPDRLPQSNKPNKNIAIPVERINHQTSLSFKINRPYTIKSEHKVKVIPIKNFDMPADYEYVSVPKVNPNAILIAYVKDWDKYDLLSGESNVFIDGTSVGKTLMDTQTANDTLQISLGVDNGIQITRKLENKFTGRKFIGSKRTEMRHWKITVKNNKNQPVNIKVHDQVPVSVRNDVTVEVIEKSGGKINSETGEVIWRLQLQPGEKKILNLKYAVKLPKYDQLIIE